MSRPARTFWVLTVIQVAALVATFPLPGLGAALWHHVASLGVVLVASAALHRPMRARGFLAVGVLASTVLATVSGFYLLYWKEGIRVDGYQDWGVFWHVAWSWAAMVFFFQHTWVNRVSFVYFLRGSFRRLGPAALHGGLYALALVALWLTWGPWKASFTSVNYIPLSLATWLVVVVPAYAVWLFWRSWARADVWRVRRRVDLGLVPMAALAVLSGLPLLFLGDLMDRMGWKYVSKYWHVWPSVVFSVLVFVHSMQAWKTVRAHWTKMSQVAAASSAPGRGTPRRASGGGSHAGTESDRGGTRRGGGRPLA